MRWRDTDPRARWLLYGQCSIILSLGLGFLIGKIIT